MSIFIIKIIPIFKVIPRIQYIIVNQLWIVDKEPSHLLLEILYLTNIYILLRFDRRLVTNITALWILRLEVYFFTLWDKGGLLLLVFISRLLLLLLIVCVHLLRCGAVYALCWFLEHWWVVLWYHYLKKMSSIYFYA